MKHLLLVEDESNLAKGLVLNFELEGFRVSWASSGAEARVAMLRALQFPEIVVLDLSLPDVDGLELLTEWKEAKPRLPIVVLTARASDDDRIAGLRLGADDYVTKPFHLTELMLRVRGLVQRTGWYAAEPPQTLRIGTFVLDIGTSTLRQDETAHLLTELELKLLLHLWRHRGTFVSKEELLEQVWGYRADTITRTVDIFISRLRRLLQDDGTNPKLLITRRGHGWMLADDPTR